MNKMIAALVGVILVLAVAVAYLLGANSKAQQAPTVLQAAPVVRTSPESSAIARGRPQNAPVVERTVKVGLNGPQCDACGSNGRVVGLNVNGDNFLAVKAAPSMSSRRIDKLGPGFEVYVCETSKDQKWLGVVYEPDGQPSANCGVTSASGSTRKYSGRCQSGWVYAKYIDIYAG
jgi:hypothetical protein